MRGLRWRFAFGLIEAAFHVAKAGGRPYQPVEIGGRRFANVRDTDERWHAVAKVLRDYGTGLLAKQGNTPATALPPLRAATNAAPGFAPAWLALAEAA